MSSALIKPAGEVEPRPSGRGFRLWALALGVGLVVGVVVVFARTMIGYIEFLFFGAAGGRLAPALARLDPMHIVLGPVIGGAIVALLLRLGVSLGWGPSPRPYGLDEVVASRRLRGGIRASTLSLRDSFLSFLIAIVSIGTGASLGRECPAMHAGASLAVLPGRLFGLEAATRRILLGVGVAAALSAALGAPIAAVFLARELVLPRQRLSTLGPVALASFIAWIVAVAAFGGRRAIELPPLGVIPAGFHLAAPFVAVVVGALVWCVIWFWRRAPRAVDRIAARLRIPTWVLPLPAGLLIGLLILAYPQVAGAGYAPLAAGLTNNYDALLMLVLVLAKTLATGLALGGRFGGGPIVPALYVGGMLGSACGAAIAIASGQPTTAIAYFGVVGMAVAVALLLEAPVAAGLMAVELSGSPEAGGAAFAMALLVVFLSRRFVPAAARLPKPGDEPRPL